MEVNRYGYPLTYYERNRELVLAKAKHRRANRTPEQVELDRKKLKAYRLLLPARREAERKLEEERAIERRRRYEAQRAWVADKTKWVNTDAV